MAAIDIGPGATDRASSTSSTNTYLAVGNPANADGKLTSFEIWAKSNLSGVKMGTFYGSGTSWTRRDYESIGNVTAGSKQTFTGKDCDVSVNDLLGLFFSGGSIEYTLGPLGEGLYYKYLDQFGAGTQTYALTADESFSIYATGATLLPFNRHDMNGGFNQLNGGMQ